MLSRGWFVNSIYDPQPRVKWQNCIIPRAISQLPSPRAIPWSISQAISRAISWTMEISMLEYDWLTLNAKFPPC